jgi:deoxyadenosine/deoxycytidine kinase
MYKIALCGAHSTGKTTLGKPLSENLELNFLTNTMRSIWQEFGISEFEKLPADIRSTFQKIALNKQIELENSYENKGFITDRSVIDYLCYTQLSSNMSGADLQLYTNLIAERTKNYTHFIYFPIMFEGVYESLRANLDSRETFSNLALENIQKLVPQNKLLIIKNLDHNQRLEEVLKFVSQ